MRSSSSRTIRPGVLWGTALLGAMLTVVAPSFAQDAAAPPEKKATVKADKPAGLQKANEAKKLAKPGEKGDKAGTKEKGPGAKEKGPGAKKPKMAHGPKGEKGAHPGKKKHQPVNRRVAVSDYKRAMMALRAAEKAESSGTPEEVEKAKLARARAAKELKKAARELRLANREDARKLKTMSKAERQKIEVKLDMRAKKLAADRKERAEKSEESIRKELGEKVKLAPVQAELQRHAWRVARLERLIAIAEASGRSQTAVRAKQLLDKENTDHPERLKRASGDTSAAPAKDAPTPPAAKAAPTAKAPAAPAAAKPAPAAPAAPAPAKEDAK